MARSGIKKTDELEEFIVAFGVYLQAEKRASAYTLRNYSATLELFKAYLTNRVGAQVRARDLEHMAPRDFRGFLSLRKAEGLECGEFAPRSFSDKKFLSIFTYPLCDRE